MDHSKLKRNKIAIIMYKYPLGVSTMIINTIKELNKKENEVVLFIDNLTYFQSPLDYTNNLFSLIISYYNWTFIKRLYRLINKIIINRGAKLCLSHIKTYSFIYDLEINNFIGFVRSNVDNSFSHIIAVEPLGLKIAHEVVAQGQKLIYYNMELLQSKTCITGNWKSIKKLEQNSLKNTDWIVIQNKTRAKIFISDNNVQPEKVKILPIYPAGDYSSEKTAYFRQRFNIPKEKLIVIYAGNFQPWAMCLEMIHSVKSWGKDFVFVMHTWNKMSIKSPYYRKMKTASKCLPIYFSIEPIEYSKLTNVLASADIALLFYKQLDENFTEIVDSSNKLAEYLKASLPIVTLEGNSLSKFIKKHTVGVTIDEIEQIAIAIDTIKVNYNQYKKACIDCYRNYLRFESYFNKLYEDIFK